MNKKKQKNFVNWSAPPAVGALQVNKSFLLLFFKKDASFTVLRPVLHYSQRHAEDFPVVDASRLSRIDNRVG